MRATTRAGGPGRPRESASLRIPSGTRGLRPPLAVIRGRLAAARPCGVDVVERAAIEEIAADHVRQATGYADELIFEKPAEAHAFVSGDHPGRILDHQRRVPPHGGQA